MAKLGSKAEPQLNFRKVARIIEDVCHFGFPGQTDIYMSKSMKVAHAIFNTIVKLVKRHGEVTIDGFGTFYLHTMNDRMIKAPIIVGSRKIDTTKREILLVPEKKQLRWRPTNEFKEAIQRSQSE